MNTYKRHRFPPDIISYAKREKRATLGVYVRGHYTEYAQANLLRHRAALQGIESDFGNLFNKPMTEISEMDVQRWRARRAQEQKPVAFATVQRSFTALKACLNTGQKTHKVITHHQIAGVTLKRTTAQLETADGWPHSMPASRECVPVVCRA